VNIHRQLSVSGDKDIVNKACGTLTKYCIGPAVVIAPNIADGKMVSINVVLESVGKCAVSIFSDATFASRHGERSCVQAPQSIQHIATQAITMYLLLLIIQRMQYFVYLGYHIIQLLAHVIILFMPCHTLSNMHTHHSLLQ